MALKNSKVIMAKNIRLEKDYNHVLSYSESDMVALCTANAVQTFTHCMFLRHGENKIQLEMTYNNALKCNYLAFQNPDYSNKWFFAFIDSIDYINDKVVQVNYTIDEFSTWWDYWQPDECFIEREHTMDDTPGSNLIPEGLELGEYVHNGTTQRVSYDASMSLIAMCSPYEPDGTSWEAMLICGIPVSGCLTLYDNLLDFAACLRAYSQHAQIDTISTVFLIPKGIVDLVNDCTVKVITGSVSYYVFNGKNTAYMHDYSVNPRPSTLETYEPVNKKLLTAPFQGLLLHNLAGSSNFLGYEYFLDPSAPKIRCSGVPTVGCSIFSCPMNYKRRAVNYLEGIACGKWPTLSWSADIYTNWLTQNAVNIGTGLLSGMYNISAGFAGSAVTGESQGDQIGAGISEIRSIISEMYSHSLAPLTSRGTVNQGDVFTGLGENEVFAQPISITEQFARRIDKYFSRFGYQTNQTKVANQLGRSNWNFVKIANGESIGHSTNNDYFSVPTRSMETINNIYRKGVTIWHNHANIGDYSQSNTIVSTP